VHTHTHTHTQHKHTHKYTSTKGVVLHLATDGKANDSTLVLGLAQYCATELPDKMLTNLGRVVGTLKIMQTLQMWGSQAVHSTKELVEQTCAEFFMTLLVQSTTTRENRPS